MATYKREFFESFMPSARRSAAEIVPVALRFVQPRSVIDVGCGTGVWLSVFEANGVHDFLGVDGPWVDDDLLVISRDRFRVLNLTQGIVSVDRHFDLVVSLETAEHLPENVARPFVRSLTTLGPVVLFSAAIPFQGGYNHLNEQWPDYWAELFAEQGFRVIDCLRPRLWKNEQIEWWYTQNMCFFVDERHLADYPLLLSEAQDTRIEQLAIVHPRAYVEAAARAKSPGQLFQATLGALRRTFYTHLLNAKGAFHF